MGTFINLPFDILFNILISVPDIKQYKTINKEFNFIVNGIFSYFNKKFNTIVNNWKKHLKILVRELFIRNDTKSIMFLIYNYNAQEEISFYAGYYNNLKLIESDILTDMESLAIGAAEGGYIKTVKYAINRGAKYRNEIAFAAARGGNVDILNYINSDYILTIGELGVEYNHLDVVKYAIEMKKDIEARLAYKAAVYGRLKILEYLLTIKNLDINNLILVAAIFGHLNIIEHYSRYIQDINQVAFNAAKYGRIEVLKYALEHGANNRDYIVLGAIKGNKYNIVKFMLRLGITNIDKVAYVAAKKGFIGIVKLALKNNANNIEEIFNAASIGNRRKILNYLQKMKNKEGK